MLTSRADLLLEVKCGSVATTSSQDTTRTTKRTPRLSLRTAGSCQETSAPSSQAQGLSRLLTERKTFSSCHKESTLLLTNWSRSSRHAEALLTSSSTVTL